MYMFWPRNRVRKAIRYAFLAPDIVRAIVEGRQPVGLTSSYLCLLFYSSAGTSSRRALKAEMRARTNDEIM